MFCFLLPLNLMQHTVNYHKFPTAKIFTSIFLNPCGTQCRGKFKKVSNILYLTFFFFTFDSRFTLSPRRETMFAPGNGVRPNVPHLAFLVTDAQANIEASDTQNEANLTKAAGIEIFTVGITNQVDFQQLQEIASPPFATHYYYVADYSKLNQVLNDLVAQACLNLPTVPTTLPTTTAPTTPTTTTSTTTTSTAPSTTTKTTSPTTVNYTGISGAGSTCKPLHI